MRYKKFLFAAIAIFTFSACLVQQSINKQSIVVNPESSLVQNQPQPIAESSIRVQSQRDPTIEYPEVLEALHQFHWMAVDGVSPKEFDGKPFLQKNNDGLTGAAGVMDINRDGEMEFLLATWHFPRGIPSVEVFALQGGKLQSTGGFFTSEFYNAQHRLTLPYYRDNQGRLLLAYNTESGYGGTVETLVSTNVTTLHTFPIASKLSDYTAKSSSLYSIFPEGEEISCTNYFLCTGSFEYEYPRMGVEVTKEEYDKTIATFMESLTWAEDVELAFSCYYQLFNGYDMPIEVRYDEIREAYDASPKEASAKYQSPEELKKTSDMVADALYEAYVTAMK